MSRSKHCIDSQMDFSSNIFDEMIIEVQNVVFITPLSSSYERNNKTTGHKSLRFVNFRVNVDVTS